MKRNNEAKRLGEILPEVMENIRIRCEANQGISVSTTDEGQPLGAVSADNRPVRNKKLRRESVLV